MQLCIRWVSDILLLYCRIYKSCVKMILIIILSIDTDTLSKNDFHSFFAYTISEVNQIGSFAWFCRKKFQLTTEILVISIFTPL